ncbi:beta-glucosidase 12-like isoform X2 [Punica granatum]|uniref:Beta-glucosidase 12-like isoform X2 n=1 Tax=Punica granatum TaxID=22663 RepID=A0A6P8CMW2_PUNGR|nr:beta-glucosidase 12-like isoform X2 [Punica granatum]
MAPNSGMNLRLLVLLLLVLGLLNMKNVAGYGHPFFPKSYSTLSLKRSSFPPGFIFGVASSSYQYEGAANEDGRGPSIWDYFTHTYPDGKLSGGVNHEGIQYYNHLIDELLANGIEPYVTLFHWDLPQTLDDEYGGFLSPRVVDDYRDFVDVCFEEFGDRVKHWITINEPWTYSYGGYAIGDCAPGRCSAWQQLNCTGGDSGTEPYLVAHHLLLAHAAAVKLYKENYQASQNGSIGITLTTQWFEPYSDSVNDRNAALRAFDFVLGWFMDPLINGDYPYSMRSLVGRRLPRFTNEQSIMVKDSFDFIGMNYYTANYAQDAPRILIPSYTTDSCVYLTTERYGVPIGPPTAMSGLFVYPEGIWKLIMYIKNKYGNPLIFITENGLAESNNSTLPLEQQLYDPMRIKFHYSHLSYLLKAIKEGANVKGYFAWSFLDDFEWYNGYTIRFGVNYVDYQNELKRYPKYSTFWFKSFLERSSMWK